MLFNSYVFIFLFLPAMLIGYFWLLRQRLILASKVWLVGGSLFFYGYWNIIYIPLLLVSIFMNFFIGSALAEQTEGESQSPTSQKNIFKYFSSKQLLLFGIIFNVCLLAYFKYMDFFLQNFNGIFGVDIPLPHIILPLGISFFTFTQIAFLVDAYKNEVKEYDLLRYMLFVTYFPHLLAGPILHHKEMMPQFANKWNFAIRWRNVAIGLFLFSVGLFKKVAIADTFANWANAGFDTAATLNFFEAWATSLSYTLQLYFDFSGYTDMAIGASLMFNIRLPINFNSPYKAKDIQDFWRRWHMTLSRFLRDYIYIPLGGNKVAPLRNYLNLFAVFIIGGFWHGASWMFVIWGALHGGAIVVHRIWKEFGFTMNQYLAWFVTFNFVNIAWVFFRAKDLASVEKILAGMVGFGGINLPERLASKLSFLEIFHVQFNQSYPANINMIGSKELLFIVAVLLLVLFIKNTQEFSKRISYNSFSASLLAILTALSLVLLNRPSHFLYFQF